LATGFAGAMAGGDLPRTSLALGAAVTVNEESGWGADMDFSFADDDSTQQALDVTAFMVNANWTKPHGFWRPYVSGGLGRCGCTVASRPVPSCRQPPILA
jgi:hypothetical protein